MRVCTLILVCVFTAVSAAQNDEVRLKNGSVIQGRIVRDDKDGVVIEFGRGRMNLLRRDVVAVTLARAEPVDGPATPPSTEGQPQPAPRRVGVVREGTRETPTPAAPLQPPRGARTTANLRVVQVERVATPDRTPAVDGPEAPVTTRKGAKAATTPESKSPARSNASKPSKADW